jgi:peptidyl-prolyl cis-trans isomerase SurA
MEELIEERLKLQEAKKQNAVVSDDEVNRVLESIAQRNKMTLAEFTKQVGGNTEPMKNRIRASMSWTEVVRRRFGPLISVNNRDVDKLVASSTNSFEQDVQLRVQRIRIALPAKLEENGVAKRIQEAEAIRSKFTDCKSMAASVSGTSGAKFEDLGERRTSTFPDPTKSMLASAGEGEMLPPSVGDGWIELYAVCSKNTANAQEDKRTQAEGELKQKEFELMSKRYLKDLRQDARIEYR